MRVIKAVLMSFHNAFNGFITAIRHERNLRIDICAALFILAFGLIYGLTGTEFAILILTVTIVPSAELINTSIEETNDRNGFKPNIHTRIAKDTAAAAVLILAVASLAVAACLFSDAERLLPALKILFTTYYVFFLIIYAATALLFIRGRKCWKKRPDEGDETKGNS